MVPVVTFHSKFYDQVCTIFNANYSWVIVNTHGVIAPSCMEIMRSHNSGLSYQTTSVSWSVTRVLFPLLTCFCHVLHCSLPLGFPFFTHPDRPHIFVRDACNNISADVFFVFQLRAPLIPTSLASRASNDLFLTWAIDSMKPPPKKSGRMTGWRMLFFFAKTSFLNPSFSCLRLLYFFIWKKVI